MDRAPLNFAFSPCPNDTFAFHAIVHGLVPAFRSRRTSTTSKRSTSACGSGR